MSTQLAWYVRAWRLRLDPEVFPDLRPDWPHGQRRRIVSQEEVARLVRCSTQWFARLEMGHRRNYSDAFVRTVAQVLQLNPDETRLLYILTGKEPPPTPISPAAVAALEPVLTGLPWPAYISDDAWNVMAHNEKMRALFPWVRRGDANLMRWAFTDPDARERLHRWGSEWAPQMLAQLRAEQIRQPGNQYLAAVIADILAGNPDAQRLWDQPLVKLHPDGDRRSICLRQHAEPQRIEIFALEPLRARGARLIMLLPVTV